MNNTLNLVYDIWDGDKPIFNGKSHYPNRNFWDFEDFIKSYVNSFSHDNESGKFIIRTHKIKDVYNNPNEKFYYIICHGSINIDEIVKGKLILSDEIQECLKLCSNFNVAFFSHHESDNENGFIYLNKSDLPNKQLYVVNNNYKLNDYVVKYNSEINVYSIMYLPIVVSLSLQRDDGTKFDINKKEKFFMCFNRGPKIQRYSLLAFMMKNNMLDNTNWSFIPLNIEYGYNHDNYSDIFSENQIKEYENEIKILNKLKLKISDYEKTQLSFNENNEITILNPKYIKSLSPPDMPCNYENSYVNIVTETKFLDEENVIQISEKSFKPFFYYQFPMILATHHHIKSLKEKYDFDFFGDLIDHSYDNEPNQKKRFKLFINEIKRLYENKENLIEFYKNNQQRFEDNKNKVIGIGLKDSDYSFIKNLLNQ